MRFVTGLVIAACTGFATLIAAPYADARIWHVEADGSGDAPTIQAAIDSALGGDVVELACGVFHEHGIFLKGGVTARSETGLADCATIDGDAAGRLMWADSQSEGVTLKGLAIANGYSNNGTGLYCHDTLLVVDHCTFRDNVCHNCSGAGLNVYTFEDVSAILTHCAFLDNRCPDLWDAGGVYEMNSYYELTAFNTDFVGNIAMKGDAFYATMTHSAYFQCCVIDYADLAGYGDVVITMEGCEGVVGTETIGWSDLRSLYRR